MALGELTIVCVMSEPQNTSRFVHIVIHKSQSAPFSSNNVFSSFCLTVFAGKGKCDLWREEANHFKTGKQVAEKRIHFLPQTEQRCPTFPRLSDSPEEAGADAVSLFSHAEAERSPLHIIDEEQRTHKKHIVPQT